MGCANNCAERHATFMDSTFSIEDRVNNARNTIKNKSYVGELYSLKTSMVSIANSDVVYGQAQGPYTQLNKECICK